MGKATFSDRSSYEGEWHEGQKSGYGKLILVPREEDHNAIVSVEGTWLDDQKHGFLKTRSQSGTFWLCNYENDNKQGFGQYDRHGEGYIGEWKRDEINGYGIHYYKKNVYLGTYKNDQMEG